MLLSPHHGKPFKSRNEGSSALRVTFYSRNEGSSALDDVARNTCQASSSGALEFLWEHPFDLLTEEMGNWARAYTRTLFSSTRAVSNTKYTLHTS